MKEQRTENNRWGLPESLSGIVSNLKERYFVNGVPGSGKTNLLAARAAYLITDRKVQPDRIWMLGDRKTTVACLKNRMQGMIHEGALSQIHLLTIEEFLALTGKPESYTDKATLGENFPPEDGVRYLCADAVEEYPNEVLEAIFCFMDGQDGVLLAGDDDEQIHLPYRNMLIDGKGIEHFHIKEIILEMNHRCSPRVTEVADRFLHPKMVEGSKSMLSPYEKGSGFRFPKLKSRKEQYTYLCKVAENAVSNTAFLCRNEEDLVPLAAILEQRGIRFHMLATYDKLQNLADGGISCQIVIGTMEDAKGKEFENVYLFDIINGILPKMSADRQAEGRNRDNLDAQMERNLFYVALTRSRTATCCISLLGSSEFVVEIYRRNRLPDMRDIPRKTNNCLVSERKEQRQDNVLRTNDISQLEFISKLRAGTRVCHKQFGYGTVLGYDGRVIMVSFQGQEKKMDPVILYRKGLLQVESCSQ